MHKHVWLTLLLVLSFLGLADSWYLAHSALTGSALTCSITGLDGCNTVAQSPYAHLFGIPLGVYGVVFYAVILVLVGILFFVRTRMMHSLVGALSVIGLLASIAFMLIQIFLIKALCVYCLGSAVIALLICIISVWLWKHSMRPKIAAVLGL